MGLGKKAALIRWNVREKPTEVIVAKGEGVAWEHIKKREANTMSSITMTTAG